MPSAEYLLARFPTYLSPMPNVIGGRFGHLFNVPSPAPQGQQQAPARAVSPKLFVVRVMLRGADSSDYDRLHEEMEGLSFEREVVSQSGETYQLPDAEYMVETNAPIDKIIEAAQHAAREVGKDAAVLVSEADNIIFSGLDQVA